MERWSASHAGVAEWLGTVLEDGLTPWGCPMAS